MKRLIASAGLLSTAIAYPAIAQDTKPLAEACPNLTAAEIAAIETYKGQFAENAWYARDNCVSVVEAERRMEIQNRDAIGPRTEPGPPPPPPAPDASIGTLQETLRSKEPGTFAGLWIQHKPTYGVMVAFTRDAAKTLARYTHDPLFVPVDRPGPSLIELRDAQDRLAADLTRLKVNWFGMGSNEARGTIEVTLGQSAAPIRAAAARGELVLPTWIVFTEPKPFPLPAPANPSGDRRVAGFPQFAFRTDGMARTLVGVPDVKARLALENGCLWLYPEDEEPKIAIWEQGMAVDLTDPQRVAVMSRFDGAKVYADTSVVLSGLQPGEVEPPQEVAGAGSCPGPYRVVRGISPRAAWDARQRADAIAERTRELGSRAAAEADYVADMARLGQLREWRARALVERGDVVTQIWINEGQGTAHMFHTAARDKDALVPLALRQFVTAQIVPQGGAALETARADIAAKLAAADVEAQIMIEPIGGTVEVRAADLPALSAAAMAGKVSFPPLVRIASDNQNAIIRQDIPLRKDPEAIWYPLEKHPDFAAIRALVEKTPVMRPEPPRPGETEDRWIARLPGKAGSLQQTHFLIAYGLTLRIIEALRRAGIDPVTAIEDMNGRQTVQKRALTATDIVIVEPVGTDLTDAGDDGFAATARWRVLEVLKGNVRPGETLRQRLASGMRADDKGTMRYGQNMDEPFLLPGLPTSLAPGSHWVLHLNDALYRHLAYTQGGDGAARSDGRWFVSVPWMTPARIEADGLVHPVTNYPEPLSLAELRSAVAPVEAALKGIK